MMSVGRCTASMVQAMVALLPLPVMPSSVWYRSPRRIPAVSSAMARGWSPAGEKSATSLKSGMPTMVPRPCDNGPDRSGSAEAGPLPLDPRPQLVEPEFQGLPVGPVVQHEGGEAAPLLPAHLG